MRLPAPVVKGLMAGVLVALAACTEPEQDRSSGTSVKTAFFQELPQELEPGFVHVNGASGRKYLPEAMGAGGCVLDYDRDGWMDLYLVQSGEWDVDGIGGENRLYRNLGGSGWEDVTLAAGAGAAGYGQGAIAGDVDGDGDDDLFIANFGADLLLRNNGDGSFSDITETAGVGDSRWSTGAAFFDADGDGLLDLYVVGYLDYSLESHRECGDLDRGVTAYCPAGRFAPAADRFYRNTGDGVFEDRTEAAGLAGHAGRGLGIAVFDFDNDRDPDLYVANDGSPNFLFVNDGLGGFREMGLELGAGLGLDGRIQGSKGVAVGDLNDDGFLDLFVTNARLQPNSLFLGGGKGFRDAIGESGLLQTSLRFSGFGVQTLDLDNDGDLDLFVGNGDTTDNIEYFNDRLKWRQPSAVFLNNGNGHFLAAPEAGIGGLAAPRVARAALTLDFDNDGGLDLLVCENNGPVTLARNTGGGHWIGFRLEGGDRTAVGARLVVILGKRSLIRERVSGSGYLSGNDPRLHFGLGDAERIDRLEVHWPGGELERHQDLAADRYYLLRRGQDPTPEGKP